MAATIKIIIDSSSSGSAIKDARRDLDDLDGGARKAGGGFDLLKTAGVAAFAAVAAGAVAAGKFLADSVSVAADFESGMLSFGAAAGQGFEQGTEKLDEFHDLFLQLGKDLPVSTKEVQDAAIALVKGGIDPAVIKAGALKDSLQFAAAAGMDLEAAAELTVKQLGTFVDVGASVEEQTRFMAESQELLVKAAGASTLNVDALGDAMLSAGGQAKAAGLDYEDFVTTMGLISPAFGSAAEAGTSFKNMLVRLQPSTQPAKDAFEELELNIFNTQKAMEYLKNQGIEPLGEGADVLKRQIYELGIAQGATEKEANKFLDAFSQSAFYDAQGQFIGMREAAVLLQDRMAGLTDQQKIQYLQTIFGNDAMAAANALISAGGEGYDAFAAKMEAANGVAKQSEAVQQGLAFAWENFKGSVEALQITLGEKLLPILTVLVNSYLTPLINKIMEVVDTFGTAEEGGATLASSWGASFATIRLHVETAMNAIWTVIQLVVEQIMLFWEANGAEITAFTQETWTTITEIVNLAVELYALYISTVFNEIAAFIRTHGTEIQAVLRIVWETIKTIVTVALALIKGVIQTVLAVVKGDWQGAWDAIKTMTIAVWEALKSLFTLNLNLISVLFKQVWTELKIFFQGILDGMVGWVLQTLQGIVNALTSFAGTAKSAAGSIGDAIVNGISSGIESGAGAIINAAKNAAMDALNAAKAALGIGSPSKLFADKIGLPMAQGMAVGLAGGAPMVAGAGAYAANAALSGASSTYNQQRSMTLIQNYNGVPASPPMDLAMANSLAGV